MENSKRTTRQRVSERAVRAELNLLLYKQAPGGILINILAAVVLGWFMWDFDRKGAIPGWLMLNLAGNIWRFIPVYRVMRTYGSLNLSSAAQDDSYLAIYTAGCAVMGLGWGLTPFILVSPDVGFAGAMVFAVMVAIISASSLTLSFRPVAQTAFIFAVALPTLSWLGLQYSSEYTTFGMMGIAYGVLLLFAGWSYARLAAGSIRIRLQNQRLVSSLSKARDRSESVNRELRNEVGLRRELQERLQREKDRLGVTLQAMDSGVVVVDAKGRVEFMNPKAQSFLGNGIGKLRGQPIAAHTAFFSDRSRNRLAHPVKQCLEDNRQVELLGSAVLALPGSERRIPVDVTVSPISRRNGGTVQGAVMVLHDMSEVRAQMREMAHQTRHDSLTGLMSRREFETQVENAMQSAAAGGPTHVLCYLDLDRFKPINDTAGHRAGDEFLKRIARILSSQVRNSDIVARVGGDEFNILLHECPMEHAQKIAEKIREKVAEYRFEWDEHLFNVGVSIGLTTIDGKSQDLEDLMHQADAACYAAKEHGRNQVRQFNSGDEAVQQRNVQVNYKELLGKALENDALKLSFEPAKILAKGQGIPNFVEVKVALRDDSAGSDLSPEELAIQAETTGLASRFDRWVIKRLLQALRQQLSVRADDQTRYAINLSGQALAERKFVDFLQNALAASGVPGDRLVLELNSRHAMADIPSTARFMYALNRRGVNFAIDCFDRDLSAFHKLRELPIGYLKFTGGRLAKLNEDDAHGMAALRTIVDMAHARSMKTVAVEVTNAELMQTLLDAKVDYVQGRAIAESKVLVA